MLCFRRFSTGLCPTAAKARFSIPLSSQKSASSSPASAIAPARVCKVGMSSCSHSTQFRRNNQGDVTNGHVCQDDQDDAQSSCKTQVDTLPNAKLVRVSATYNSSQSALAGKPKLTQWILRAERLPQWHWVHRLFNALLFMSFQLLHQPNELFD